MLKDLLKRLEETEEEVNKLDAMWEAEPENTSIENAWNKAYEENYKHLNTVIDYIISLIGIDKKTALKMVIQYRNDLHRIAAMEV